MIGMVAVALMTGIGGAGRSTPPATDSLAAAPALAATVAGAPDDPVVRITMEGSSTFGPGDRAHVRVHVRDDAYLVVLQAAPDGHVMLLYPRHPDDNAFVRGGSDFELPGAHGRETFTVADVAGTGTIVAAVSKDAFHFDGFTVNGNWDYRALPDTAN